MGFSGEAISDYSELTEAEDIKTLEDLEEQHAVENRRRRNQQILEASESQKDPYFLSAAPRLEEETLKAKDILETITILNGQDDIGVEDFIKNIKSQNKRFTTSYLARFYPGSKGERITSKGNPLYANRLLRGFV